MGLAARERRFGIPTRRAMMRLARTLALALTGATLLAIVVAVRAGTAGTLPAALACGLGKPQTMLANKVPALFYPSTQNNPKNVAGLFPLDYAVNTPIAFTEDLSRAPGSPSINTFTWRWSFGDGTGYFYEAQPTHTYTKPGDYDVISWVYIDGSWADNDPFDSSQIHIAASIPSNPPVAKVNSSMPITALTQPVAFSADGSHASDGSQLKYTWNFNDSGEASGLSVNHPFIIPGSTFVALIVTDGRGAKSLATVNITIQSQQPPTAALSASDLEIDAGGTINFDASQSAAPPGVAGDSLTKYVWSFGDGGAPQTTETATTAHRYAKAGSYAVTMTVFDKNQTQATAIVHVRVLGAATGGISPLVIGGVLALLVALAVGIYLYWQQRRRAAMVRRYQEAQAMARARRAQQRGGPRSPGGSYGRSGIHGNPGRLGNSGNSGNYGNQSGRGDYRNSGRQPVPREGQRQRSSGNTGRHPRYPDDAPDRSGRGDW